jgi:hypothetical protein
LTTINVRGQPSKRVELLQGNLTSVGPENVFGLLIVPSSSPPDIAALRTWRKKLAYLREQEAVLSDPAQKFAVRVQIEEAELMIRQLSG